MKKRGFISFWIRAGLIVSISTGLLAFQPHELISASVDIQKGEKADFLQFTAGDHVLGFGNDRMYVAASDHMAGIVFVDSKPVEPKVRRGTSATAHAGRKTLPLEKVTYEDLWDGVTLVYDCEEGAVLKSTYHISPPKAATVDDNSGYPHERIRLRYNVPVTVASNGALVLDYQTGRLKESPPIAWQKIEGNRVPVEASFRLLSDREVGFQIESYDPAFPLIIDPVLSWHTFMGSGGSAFENGTAITLDSKGNIYVAGYSGNWGSPLNTHAGGMDAFVAKLNHSGVLQWHTFMGAADNDYVLAGIALDNNGNIYVTGYSEAGWGKPINAHAGGTDAFVAKLNHGGVLQWHTFMGSASDDYGRGIALDGNGYLYVSGYSEATWGSSPLNAHAGGYDAFAAKLNSNGVLQWNTFVGSSSNDLGYGIAVDSGGNLHVTGKSDITWGSSPVNAHAGGWDAFVAKLNTSGALLWNTFMGNSNTQEGWGITLDGSGNIYVTGLSFYSWGSPVNPHGGVRNAFAAKLNSSGARLWHTFMGGPDSDDGYGIALDTSGNAYVTGRSYDTWGSPVNPHSGGSNFDAFAAKLNSSGALLWNTFMGSTSTDQGWGIASSDRGDVYMTGESYAAWGSPINPHAGGGHPDAFAAKLKTSGSLGWLNLLLD